MTYKLMMRVPSGAGVQNAMVAGRPMEARPTGLAASRLANQPAGPPVGWPAGCDDGRRVRTRRVYRLIRRLVARANGAVATLRWYAPCRPVASHLWKTKELAKMVRESSWAASSHPQSSPLWTVCRPPPGFWLASKGLRDSPSKRNGRCS